MQALEYGSDQNGLVCGYLFGRGPQAVPIEASEAAQWLRSDAGQPGEFLWLHFNLANTASEKWLREQVQLSEEFYDCLHQGSR